MPDFVQKQSPTILRRNPCVHVVTTEELVRSVAGQNHLDAGCTHLFEDLHRNNRIDDIAVFSDLRHPDVFADIRHADIARRQCDYFVRNT